MKVEASKFTEVGYVGRDVESMVRDLVEAAVEAGEGGGDGEGPVPGPRGGRGPGALGRWGQAAGDLRDEGGGPALRAGTLDDENVEIEVPEAAPTLPMMAGPGMEEMAQGLQDMFKNMGQGGLGSIFGGGRKRKRKLPVGGAGGARRRRRPPGWSTWSG